MINKTQIISIWKRINSFTNKTCAPPVTAMGVSEGVLLIMEYTKKEVVKYIIEGVYKLFLSTEGTPLYSGLISK